MVQQLLNHLDRHNLCKTTDKILLAVSGGLDSMVMLYLFRQAGFSPGVAHCNFQLRGEASASDEALVSEVCAALDIQFHVQRFETATYASEKKLSIQMAARELRYGFFQQLLAERGYKYLATAHHLNDSLETVVLNLVRGTGIDGVAGIPVKTESVIRPMLFATRKMIEDYAALNSIRWHEDISNAGEDYQRNYIRHQIIPRLKEINPSLEDTFGKTQERLNGAKKITSVYINEFRNRAVRNSAHQLIIDKKKLNDTPAPVVVLWELIKDAGFNFAQCEDMLKEHQAGKFFVASPNMLTVDRESFILAPVPAQIDSPVSIGKPTGYFFTADSGILHCSVHEKKGFQVEKNPEIAQLDLAKVKFPLLLRRWKPGDFFIPIGMRNAKKVSDFLVDMKMPLPEKENVMVVESDGTIIWIAGLRIHDNFKVTPETDRVLLLRFERK